MKPIIWKPIKGHGGKYEVSNFGDVKSLPNKLHPSEIILKPSDWLGYLTVNLSGKSTSVAYLVACAFVPNPNRFKYVKCIDGNIHNVNADNLKWVETKEEADGFNPISLSEVPVIIQSKKIFPDALNVSEEADCFVITQYFSKAKLQKDI